MERLSDIPLDDGVGSQADAAALSVDQTAEVAFLSGVDASGRTTATTYWSWNKDTPATYSTAAGSAHKWQGGPAGSSGGVISYYFDPSSYWTTAEQQGWVSALSLWSAVANVQFVQTNSANAANVTFYRNSGNGTFESGNYNSVAIGSSVLGANSVSGSYITFDASGVFGDFNSFSTKGGYAVGTIVHEVGHLLGLGHAGPYNGGVNPATQQFSPADTRLWTVMSYILPSDSRAKYYNQYPVSGTNWGTTSDGWSIASSYTWMPLDILAVQRLYGLPVSTPLSGGQVFGFNCNISGPLNQYFNFGIDTRPVVTLWDAGANNSLDLSQFASPATVNLNPGTFSSCDGMTNNIAIAFNTRIDHAIGGGGNDQFIVNTDGDTLDGGGGTNTVIFPGYAREYTIAGGGSTPVTVTDSIAGRNGTDTLSNVRYLQFADRTIDVLTLQGPGSMPRNDFNGDGRSDILWQNNDGTPAIWLLNGTTATGGGIVLGNPGASWHVVGSGDFNADGKSDILWQNNDGTPAVWLLNGTTAIGGGTVSANPGPSWHAIDSGDFNADGRSDILWQNSDGTPAVWLLNATTAIGGGIVLGNPGPSWHAIASGDFNADGKSDILWQNDDGTPAIWLLNGTIVIGGGVVLGSPGASWHAIGCGDFNGDGRSDILWQNSDGTPAVWLLNGTTAIGGGTVGANPGTSWHEVGSGAMQFISGNASAADTMATSAVSDQPSPASSPGEFNATVELPGLGGASPFEFSGSQGGISGAGSKSLGLDTQQFVPDALRASAYPSA